MNDELTLSFMKFLRDFHIFHILHEIMNFWKITVFKSKLTQLKTSRVERWFLLQRYLIVTHITGIRRLIVTAVTVTQHGDDPKGHKIIKVIPCLLWIFLSLSSSSMFFLSTISKIRSDRMIQILNVCGVFKLRYQ